jgi:hypothetical protein
MYLVTVEVGEDLLTDPAVQEVEVGEGEDVEDVDFAVVEDVSGSISGTVSTELEDVSVEGLTVTADPAAEGVDAVTTTTAADGTYSFASLAPGNYTVSVAVGDGQATDPVSDAVELAADEVETGVDFAIVAAT